MKIKLDSLRLAVIRQFSEIANQLDLEFVIVGAAARDLILFNQYGIETRRRTEDIDFAVLINSWQKFESLRSNLLATQSFIEDDTYHSVIFQNAFPIDFIPFGDVEDEEGRVLLPPDFAFELNMEGFKEVFEKAIQLELDKELIINVTSLPGLAILKLFAWKNRIKGSDAFDLSIIIENYIDAGNKKRFFNEYTEIVEKDGFDYILASAWLLGKDLHDIFQIDLQKSIVNVISTEDRSGFKKLAFDLSFGSNNEDNSYQNNLVILNNLINGINNKQPIFE